MQDNRTATNNTTNQQQPTCLPAGRYEFKDAGIYIGEWLNEKAVGLGLITKDKCQGEYTGLWDNGSEKSGVFLWPNAPGAMYEGEWASNRRNGYGVFTREDWVIMGKFVDDFVSFGVKCKESSIGRFEGEFENGFPSFGVETYADEGTYAGEYKNGVREGVGVRTSIPFGEIINFFPEEAALAAEVKQRQLEAAGNATTAEHQPPAVMMGLNRRQSLSSNRSIDFEPFVNEFDSVNPSHPSSSIENDLEDDEPRSSGKQTTALPTSTGQAFPGKGRFDAAIRNLPMSCKFKCGFVLSSQRSELAVRHETKLYNKHCSKRKGKRGGGGIGAEHKRKSRSLTSLFSRSTSRDNVHGGRNKNAAQLDALNNEPPESVFNLDHDDAIDPETIEIYAGQWEADSRTGYGTCERSDGVAYEGQWLKNRRHGYGRTRFPDGKSEQGRYQFGKLVFLSWSKPPKPYLILQNYHISREVASSVKRAQIIAEQARMRATEATENLEKIIQSVGLSKRAAEMARDYSLETRELVREMYPDFDQPGIKYLEDMVRLMKVTKRGNQSFESALEAAKSVMTHPPLVDADTNGGNGEEGLERLGHVGDLGKPISRAGSYRLRRQQSFGAAAAAKRAVAKSKQTGGEGEQQLDTDRVDDPTSPVPEQTLTLVVPQLTSYQKPSPHSTPTPQNGHESSSLESFDRDDTSDLISTSSSTTLSSSKYSSSLTGSKSTESSFGSSRSSTIVSSSSRSSDAHSSNFSRSRSYSDSSRSSSTSETSSIDSFGRPVVRRGGSISSLDSSIDSNFRLPSMSTPKTDRRQLESSVDTLYLEVPPPPANPAYNTSSSPLPYIPMNGDLLSNSVAIGDYFDQYVNQSDIMPLSTNQRQAFDQQLHQSATGTLQHHRQAVQPSATLDQSRTNIGLGLGRRRTLPSFIQPPVGLTLTSDPNRLTSDGRKANYQKLPPIAQENETSLPGVSFQQHPRRTVSRSSLISGHSFTELMAEEEEQDAIDLDEISLLEHHRLQGRFGRTSDLDSLAGQPTSPLLIIDERGVRKQTEVNRRRDDTLKKDRCLTALKPLSHQPVNVVGNVLLDDELQDQLVELTVDVRERPLVDNRIGSRLSVPDLRDDSSPTGHLRDGRTMGLSPSELAELSRCHWEQLEVEKFRQNQGEVVIQLLDLYDWCNQNLLLVSFVLVNCSLMSFFYMLIYGSANSKSP